MGNARRRQLTKASSCTSFTENDHCVAKIITNGSYCIIDQGAWWMNILIAIIDRKASPVSFLLRDVSLYGIFNPW
jgi:hypothetical protein